MQNFLLRIFSEKRKSYSAQRGDTMVKGRFITR